MDNDDFKNIQITDDYMFYSVMEAMPNCCQRIIELAIGKKIKEIKIRSQMKFKQTTSSKGIVIDVHAYDEDAWYTVEMQTCNNDDIPKRARYYHSATDMECVKKGEFYRDLKDNHVIFICNFDLFKRGLPVYKVNKILNDDLKSPYTDGLYTVFLNARYKNPNGAEKDVLSLLDYIGKQKVCDELTSSLDAKVKELQNNDVWREQYMDARQEEMRAEYRGYVKGKDEGLAEGLATGRAEGLATGRAEGLSEAYFTLLKEGKITVSDVAKALGITEAEVEKRFKTDSIQ